MIGDDNFDGDDDDGWLMIVGYDPDDLHNLSYSECLDTFKHYKLSLLKSWVLC